MISRTLVVIGMQCLATTVFAQGQDSQPYERDLQVLATLLPGAYDNANQSYFDRRGDRSVKHRRVHMTVAPVDDAFLVEIFWDNNMESPAQVQRWTLAADDKASAVRMTATNESDPKGDSCTVFWRRDAHQLRGTSEGACAEGFAKELVIGTKHLWMDLADVGDGDFKLHRARAFECYADIPGVGGGRDEPYDRYEDFKIHDQGGAVWFTSKEGRKLGISLFLVDWPINNYEGIFTRDSFVIYVSEEIDGQRKEHGYAFTIPTADRIGINLKWMLASCFVKSNKLATPYL